MFETGTRILIALLLLALLTTAAFAAPAKQSAAAKLYERAERFGMMGNLVYKANVDAHWIGDTHTFWYRNDVRGDSEFILVDADRGTRQVAFDHAKLAKSLSKATGATFTKGTLPFTAISFTDSGRTLIFRFGSQWWSCSLDTYELTKIEAPKGATTTSIPNPRDRRRPQAEDTQPGPQPDRSPDGKYTAFIKDNNLYITPTDGGLEKQLSTDGDAKNAYVRVFWSPDSQRLVAWKTEFGDNLPMYTIEAKPKDSLRPKLHQTTYALPGDKLDLHRPYVFTLTGQRTETTADPVNYGDIPDVRWLPDGRCTFEQTDRAYKRVRVNVLDPTTGEVTPIVDEKSRTFVFPPCETNRYLDSNELIWPSERDGWCHLYLYDLAKGALENQITRGNWVVRNIDSVDESARTITFTASGREPGQDPYLIHFYRISFDGSNLVSLTPANGQHAIRYSPDKAFYLDSYSRVDLPPVTELRRTSDGSLVCELERADIRDLLKTGWTMPEPFVAKARDGVTDIYGVIIRPSHIDPHKRYPVIEDIYAGPQSSFVPKTFTANRANQALAELGFIVVHIDGMGTGNRSKAFHDVCYQNLGDSGFPDRIAWMKEAAKRYPYMDLTRVGIHGMSAGGYNAAHAVLAHPEFYKVAVSMSGNHDHRTDKVWWNELWMGYPIGPHYAEQSNMTMAANLTGKLLLMHGDADDNVNVAAATLQLADALIKANRDFDMLIIPGMNHAIIPYEQRKMWDYYVRNLLKIEPPANYLFKSAAGSECNITIKNLLDKPVQLFWQDPDGKLQPYPDVPPGQSTQRHTFIGHQWEAQLNGKTISTYTANARALEWTIMPD